MGAYLSNVKITKAPLAGIQLKVCVVMTLAAVAKLERVMDRVAPAVLLALGLASAGAMALIGA